MSNKWVEEVEKPKGETAKPAKPAVTEEKLAIEIKGNTKAGTTKTEDTTNMMMYAILLGKAGTCAFYVRKRSKKGQ